MSSRDNLTIKLIHEDSPFVEEVIKLADENKATLGFNRHSMYKQKAKSPGIFIAVVNNDFAGHLMWSMNSRTRYIRIWQLCIHPKYRGKKLHAN